MEDNDWPVEELDRLKQNMHDEKYNAAVCLSAAILSCGAAIFIWIRTTFYDCIPMASIGTLFLMLSYSKWKCSYILKSYLNIVNATKDLLNKLDQEVDKKKGETHG